MKNIKNILKFLFIIIGLLSVLPVYAAEYRVIKVSDGDTVYLDFNGDGNADNNERVRLNGIDAFEVHASSHLDWQMRNYSLTYKQVLFLGYLGREFAQKELLNKYVNASYSAEDKFDKYGRPLMSLTYDNGKSFEKEILKAGLATVYSLSNCAKVLYRYENLRKLNRIAKKSDKYDFGFYDYDTKQYHPVESSEAANPYCVLVPMSK